MAISTALHSLSSSLGRLNRLPRSLASDPLPGLSLGELRSVLSEAEKALAIAEQEIRSRDNEIRRLVEALVYRGDTVERTGSRYRAVDGEPVGMPLCPVCELDGRFITQTFVSTKVGSHNECPKCKSVFSPNLGYGYPDGI